MKKHEEVDQLIRQALSEKRQNSTMNWKNKIYLK